MKKRLIFGVAGLFIGFITGATGGWLLVMTSSPNIHDKSLEAIMTAFFAVGPICAVVGCLVGLLLGGSGNRREDAL